MDHNSFKSFAIQKKGSKNCKFTTRTLHIRLNSSDWKGLTERQKSFSKSSDILLNLFFIKKFVIFYVNFGKKNYIYMSGWILGTRNGCFVLFFKHCCQIPGETTSLIDSGTISTCRCFHLHFHLHFATWTTQNADLICFLFEWLSPEMRMWIITLWKQILYNHFPQEQFLTEKDTWSRCEGKDTRVKWKSRSSPQRLRRIYPSGGKVSRKINGLNKPGRMSHLSEGELHVEKYLSCESFDKVVVKGTRFSKKLRMYCLGKAEWKCKSGD